MKNIKYIHLTRLCHNLDHLPCDHCNRLKCEMCQESEKSLIKIILKKLENKNSDDFMYCKYDYTENNEKGYSKSNILFHDQKDFLASDKFLYDERTLCLIIKLMKKIGHTSKKVIEIMKDAGIVHYSNGTIEDPGSSALSYVLSNDGDEEICWYIYYLGLLPGPYCIIDYAIKKRTFFQISRMWNILFDFVKNFNLPSGMISYCYSLTSNIEEIKHHIDWFLSKGYKHTDEDFINSIAFGTQLFDFLYERGIRITNPENIIHSNILNIEQKIAMLIYTNNHQISGNCYQYNLSGTSKYGSLELIKLLMFFGANVTESFLSELIGMRLDPCQGENITFDFITECLDYVLNNSNIVIPCLPFSIFHNKEYYNFDDRLYNWMIETQPKMQDSVFRMIEYKTNHPYLNDIWDVTLGHGENNVQGWDYFGMMEDV